MGKSLTDAICVLFSSPWVPKVETSPLGVRRKILSIWWGLGSGLEKYENLIKRVHDDF
jgi:hypothetical protein